MFECYLFSQFACTTVYGTPSEILWALHHLIAEKGQRLLFLKCLGDLHGVGTGSQKVAFIFIFFNNTGK